MSFPNVADYTSFQRKNAFRYNNEINFCLFLQIINLGCVTRMQAEVVNGGNGSFQDQFLSVKKRKNAKQRNKEQKVDAINHHA